MKSRAPTPAIFSRSQRSLKSGKIDPYARVSRELSESWFLILVLTETCGGSCCGSSKSR